MKSDKLEETTIKLLSSRLNESRRDNKDIPYGLTYAFDNIVEILGLDRTDDYFGAGGICRFDNCSLDQLNKILNDSEAKNTVDLNSSHNESPTIAQFKDFMEANKDHNFQLCGYLVVPERDDYPDNDRFEVDGISIDALDEAGIEILKNWVLELHNADKIIIPADFDVYDDVFLSWWD